jgi:hypothetical protein
MPSVCVDTILLRILDISCVENWMTPSGTGKSATGLETGEDLMKIARDFFPRQPEGKKS